MVFYSSWVKQRFWGKPPPLSVVAASGVVVERAVTSGRVVDASGVAVERGAVGRVVAAGGVV